MKLVIPESTPPRLFIVVYDDEQGTSCPMTWDADCEGALCVACHGDKIALFTSRVSARKAITISAKFSALRKSQGKPENTDFTTEKKNIRIKECAKPRP